MKIRPLHDRVLVRRAIEETTTPGGIVLPSSATEKPVKGKVIAVGKGKKSNTGTYLSLDVKVGDEVYFGKYSGTEVKLDHEELLMMREEDIMGIIE
jgi:chaperonin GroES